MIFENVIDAHSLDPDTEKHKSIGIVIHPYHLVVILSYARSGRLIYVANIAGKRKIPIEWVLQRL